MTKTGDEDTTISDMSDVLEEVADRVLDGVKAADKIMDAIDPALDTVMPVVEAAASAIPGAALVIGGAKAAKGALKPMVKSLIGATLKDELVGDDEGVWEVLSRETNEKIALTIITSRLKTQGGWLYRVLTMTEAGQVTVTLCDSPAT